MGRTYDGDTHWLAVLREAARYPLGPSWLRSDLDVASGLADLADQLRGSSAEPTIAEAALSLVETGTSDERTVVWQLPWERATNAVERLLTIIRSERARLEQLRGVSNVIWRLLQAYPGNAQLIATLRAEAALPAPDPWILEMLQQHAPK